MARPLRALVLGDSVDDCVLVSRVLQRSGWDPKVQRVSEEPGLAAALDEDWDVILSDLHLAHLDALRALQMLHERGKDVPFLVVSGTTGEELAVQAMKAGAGDFIGKHALTRLPSALE